MFSKFFTRLNQKAATKLVEKVEPLLEHLEKNGKFSKIDTMNKNLAENVRSKFKPIVNEIKKEGKFDEEFIINKTLASSQVVAATAGAAMGAASVYDKNASLKENLATGIVVGTISGGYGYVAPPLTAMGVMAAAKYKKTSRHRRGRDRH